MKWQDIRAKDCEFSPRTEHCLCFQFGDKCTLGKVDEQIDMDLLRIPNFGRKSLREVREVIANARGTMPDLPRDVINWFNEHEAIVLALMRGEAVIVPRWIADKQ